MKQKLSQAEHAGRRRVAVLARIPSEGVWNRRDPCPFGPYWRELRHGLHVQDTLAAPGKPQDPWAWTRLDVSRASARAATMSAGGQRGAGSAGAVGATRASQPANEHGCVPVTKAGEASRDSFGKAEWGTSSLDTKHPQRARVRATRSWCGVAGVDLARQSWKPRLERAHHVLTSPTNKVIKTNGL